MIDGRILYLLWKFPWVSIADRVIMPAYAYLVVSLRTLWYIQRTLEITQLGCAAISESINV